MTDDELRAWATEAGRDGDLPRELADEVLRLLDENADLRKQVEGHCERIAKQSELLSRKAEIQPDQLGSGRGGKWAGIVSGQQAKVEWIAEPDGDFKLLVDGHYAGRVCPHHSCAINGKEVNYVIAVADWGDIAIREDTIELAKAALLRALERKAKVEEFARSLHDEEEGE